MTSRPSRDPWINRTVLALDKFLTDPPSASALTEIRALWDKVPVGYRDQLDAAITETRSLTDSQLASGLVDGHLLPPQGHPDWLRRGALDALVTWLVRSGSGCEHVSPPCSPQPVFAAAWRPRLMVCQRCVGLLAVSDDEADRTCDGCGKVVDPGREERMHPGALELGELRYHFGVCAGCRYWAEE